MSGDTDLRARIAQRMQPDYLNQEVRLKVLDGEDLMEAVADAAAELEYRLSDQGLVLPPRTRSRMYKRPATRAPAVIKIEANPREMMIVRAVSRTYGAAQFGCSPDGSVFTADTDGYSYPGGDRRDSVTGLSPVLEEVADIFNSRWRRDGIGGRFYERNGSFFDADDRAVFVEVKITRNASFDRRGPVIDRAAPVVDDTTSSGNLVQRLAARLVRSRRRPGRRDIQP
ncbi:MAG: hypothetical protein QG597_756 [Actinomycetota bacterium]|nr:hypothetical protein [Actinomycetota bacterium]